MKHNRVNYYIIFFLVYCTISIFNFYYFSYIPVYYLDILKYDSKVLGFIQIIPYLLLVLSSSGGYYYDKYIKKDIQSKVIFYTLCIVLTGSFLAFILFSKFLIIYSIILFLNLFSISIIRIIMISLFLNIIKSNKKSKRHLVLIVRSANLFGSIIIMLFFQIFVSDIFSIEQWNRFFIIGWVISLILIILTLIFNNKVKLSFNQNNLQQKIEVEKSEGKIVKKEESFRQHLILYIACFLASADFLFIFLLSSFIFNKFGQGSFRIFTSLSFLFSLGLFIGLLIAHNLCDRIKKETVLLIGLIMYLFLMFLLTFSNFFILIILYFGLSVIASIFNFTYSSFVAEYSKDLKNKTFKYQLFHSYQSLAQFIFVPLGYLLYDSINVESIILISCVCFIVSGVLLSYCAFYGKSKEEGKIKFGTSEGRVKKLEVKYA